MEKILVSSRAKFLSSKAAVFLMVMFVISILANNGVNAQITQSTAWDQTYPGFGELSKTVIQTADGGYALLCTNYNSNDPNYAALVCFTSLKLIRTVTSNGMAVILALFLMLTADNI